MRPLEVTLVLGSVGLSAIAQAVLKHGAMQVSAKTSFGFETVLALAAQPTVIAGMGLYLLSAVLWLGVLQRLPLSQAYPFVALGFVATVGIGVLWFGENVSLLRLVGVMLIIAGVLCVASNG